MGTIIARTASKHQRKPEKKIDYLTFRILAELRGRGAISREHFILDWGLAQRDQGIKAEGRP
jgi:hypothetical protein